MTTIQIGECKCSCHTRPTVKHILACCSECPHCLRRIRTSFRSKHMETCTQNPDKKKDEPEVE